MAQSSVVTYYIVISSRLGYSTILDHMDSIEKLILGFLWSLLNKTPAKHEAQSG